MNMRVIMGLLLAMAVLLLVGCAGGRQLRGQCVLRRWWLLRQPLRLSAGLRPPTAAWPSARWTATACTLTGTSATTGSAHA